MANRAHPRLTDADNSCGSLPTAGNDWRIGDADSMAARTTPESTTDAGYTTARACPTANLSVSFLPLWGIPYRNSWRITGARCSRSCRPGLSPIEHTHPMGESEPIRKLAQATVTATNPCSVSPAQARRVPNPWHNKKSCNEIVCAMRTLSFDR